MASEILNAILTGGTHAVGNMNSWKIRTLPNGALVADTSIDNFTAVELGFDANGERTCKQLTDVTKDTYLIDGVERRTEYEDLSHYYNAQGERSRIVMLDKGIRFQTSAFSLNAGGESNGTAVTTITNGLGAHFDPTTKKFILSTIATPAAGYTTAKVKFLVVNTDNEPEYLNGKEIVRLEVQ